MFHSNFFTLFRELGITKEDVGRAGLQQRLLGDATGMPPLTRYPSDIGNLLPKYAGPLDSEER